MKKTYQPFIIEKSEIIIESLNSVDFFKNEEIKSTEYAKELICDKLTEKFISGQLTSTDTTLFTEDEMVEILHTITVENALSGLIEKGLINSFEDENGDSVFFLTENGKETAQQLNIKK